MIYKDWPANAASQLLRDPEGMRSLLQPNQQIIESIQLFFRKRKKKLSTGMSGKFAFVASTKADFRILSSTAGKLKLEDLWHFHHFKLTNEDTHRRLNSRCGVC